MISVDRKLFALQQVLEVLYSAESYQELAVIRALSFFQVKKLSLSYTLEDA